MFGYNASFLDCVNCGLEDVVSRNALCGTGMVWSGAQGTIQRSAFRANGSAASGLWSDGLTADLCAALRDPREPVRGQLRHRRSSSGYGVQTRIEEQRGPAAGASRVRRADARQLQLGRPEHLGATTAARWWPTTSSTAGRSSASSASRSGPHPVVSARTTSSAASCATTQVLGAKIGINVDGAGA